MEISPKTYGLNTRIQLKEINKKHIAIVKNIKSRIILKDAVKIIETAQSIWSKEPDYQISLMCNPNICSKSINLLNENQIGLVYIVFARKRQILRYSCF